MTVENIDLKTVVSKSIDLVPHSAMSALRSKALLSIIEDLDDNKEDSQFCCRAALILADSIAAPPTVSVSLFWKSLSAALIVGDSIERTELQFAEELQCLYGKISEVLNEAVFIRPEEVTMERCIKEIGPRAALCVNSNKFCRGLIVNIFSSICVLAKYERKSSNETFNKSAVSLVKFALDLDYSEPIANSIRNIVHDALSSAIGEFSSMLPILLLTAINETPPSSKMIIGAFVPVIQYSTKLSLNVDLRGTVDALCWKILLNALPLLNEVVVECHSRDVILNAITDFLGSQRSQAIEPHLERILAFIIRTHFSDGMEALLKSFLNGGQVEVLLKALFKLHGNNCSDWWLPIVCHWFRYSFSLSTPSFPNVWRFLLKNIFKHGSTILTCMNAFLKGLQVFGNQEVVLPSSSAEFNTLCSETAEILTSSKFQDFMDDAKERVIPSLQCVSFMALLLSMAKDKVEVVEIKDLRKFFKALLKKSLDLAANMNDKEVVMSSLLTFCQMYPEDQKLMDKFNGIILDKSFLKHVDLTSVLRFFLQHTKALRDGDMLCCLVESWLSSIPPTESVGHHLISGMCLMEKMNCLEPYLSSIKVNSTKQNKILVLLSAPSCLPLLYSSLPAKAQMLLVDLALKNLKNPCVKMRSCSLHLLGHILKREADFASFHIFSDFDVVEFMNILEQETECDPQVIVNLAKLSCYAASHDDDVFSKLVKKFILAKLSNLSSSLIVNQCLWCLNRRSRNLRYKDAFKKLTTDLKVENLSFDREKIDTDDECSWFLLSTCLMSLLDWPKFGRDRVSLDDIISICKIVPAINKFERSLWSHPLIELLSKCLKSGSEYSNLCKVAEVLLSDVFSDFDLASPAFVTAWQNVFKCAGPDAGNLLRHVLFVNASDLANNPGRWSSFCSGYFKIMIGACDNKDHSEDDHENAVWCDSDDSSIPCISSRMITAIYESVISYPIMAVHCLSAVAQHGFFETRTKGILSFDLLLAIVVGAAHCPAFLSNSVDHYTAYCSLLCSLLRLRPAQQEAHESSSPIRLSNILHLILFCLSTAFTSLLENSIPADNVGVYFQELGKLVATASYRRRMLSDSAVHVIAATFVAAVRSPIPAGFAGLPPIYRKQLITCIVQLFQMCSEKSLKSMALFLPQECLPLLKSVRSEAFVQKKVRRKV